MSKKEFKISIHSLSFRILVLLFSMIVFFLGLVIYNNTAAFRFLLKRIHENSENTLVLYQKNLDENLSRTETYLYSTLLIMLIFFLCSLQKQRQQTGMYCYNELRQILAMLLLFIL